jgi:hypothetical protein
VHRRPAAARHSAAPVLSVRAIAATFLVLALLGSQQALGAPPAAPSVLEPRLFVGVNVPWYNWGCDFGCGARMGVSAPAVKAALGDGFKQLQVAAVHSVRWWTFEGNPAQILRDSSGAPTGLDPAVYADFDAALALADQYDLVYDFVLFSSPSALPKSWISDPTQRQQLADALAPLFERYKNHPRIMAWEIFNEPEWDIWNRVVPQSDVQATVKLLADTIHARTGTAVTVGSASIEGLPLWVNQGLDFYAPHWYDPMSAASDCARCTDVATLRARYSLDALPIVIGELYAGPDNDALQRYRDFRAKGYAGAWAWSLFNDRTADKMRVDLTAVRTFTGDPTSLTPRPTPLPATPTPLPQIAVDLLANWVSPSYVLPGQEITVHQDVRSNRTTTVIIDFEVYDDAGQKVLQSVLEDQTVSENSISSISTTLALPSTLPPGAYTVKAGAFAPGWATMYDWSDWVGTVILEPGDEPTPAPPADDTGDGTSIQPGE